MKSTNPFFIFIVLLILPISIQAQTFDKIVDFLTVHPNKKAVERDSTIYPAKAIFTPVVSYAPETNLSFGVGIKGLFKMNGSGPETRTSNMPLTVQYTVENKYFFFSGFNIFFPQERYILNGNIRVQSFPSLYFGLGPETPKTNEEKFEYSQLLVEPIFAKNLFMPYLFFGGGLRYNRISRVNPEPGGILEGSEQTGSKGSTSSGIQLAMIYDNRDNVLNALDGLFVQLTHGFYDKFLGGTQSYELTRFDIRYYMQPFNKPSSILAVQLMTHFSHGDTPLLELGRLGGGDIMRGYFEGRYTDRNLFATQIEWRQKLSHYWGIVAFAGVGTVAPTVGDLDFNLLKTSLGVGLRFLIDEEENLNLRLDFGFGQEKSKFYFKIAEAF